MEGSRGCLWSRNRCQLPSARALAGLSSHLRDQSEAGSGCNVIWRESGFLFLESAGLVSSGGQPQVHSLPPPVNYSLASTWPSRISEDLDAECHMSQDRQLPQGEFWTAQAEQC